MTDCFALLDLPRQPWLDPDLLQNKFTALSARFHPDKVNASGQEAQARASAYFAELNVAFQTLRETRSRLGHLIQLETGATPGAIEQVSNESADLFFQVSSLCRQVDQFLAEKSKSTSPMMKAACFAKGLEWTDRLQAVQQVINEKRSAVEAGAHMLNEVWSAPGKPPEMPKTAAVERLKEIYAKLGYFTRWNTQLQERIVQLAV